MNTIAEHARERVRKAKEQIPFEEMKRLAFEKTEKDREDGIPDYRFEKALSGEGIHFSCEVKKA